MKRFGNKVPERYPPRASTLRAKAALRSVGYAKGA